MITENLDFNKAYIDLIINLEKKSKFNSYLPIDTLTPFEFISNPVKYINIAKMEIDNLVPLRPVYQIKIPKKNRGYRLIYVYSLIDRLKSQVVYNQVYGNFNKIYSKYLFSYIKGRSGYYAVRSFKRRYVRKTGQDYIYKGDIKDYTEQIDRQIMINKLMNLDLSKKLFEVIKLFINTTVIGDVSRNIGLIQGIPIISLLANLYLNEMDWYIGKKVSFYRRVGDDFILCDKDSSKIMDCIKFIKYYCDNNKLLLSENKSKIYSYNESFSFLGYEFINGDVQIPKSSINKRLSKYRDMLSKLKNDDVNNKLKEIFYETDENIYQDMRNFVFQFNLSDNYKQIKKMQNRFCSLLTKVKYGSITERNKRLLLETNLEIPNIYKLFYRYKRGEKI